MIAERGRVIADKIEALSLHPRVNKLAEKWFRPRSFESESLYRKLGVVFFKEHNPFTGDPAIRRKRLNSPVTIRPRGEFLRDVESETRRNEAVHVIGLIGLSLVMGMDSVIGNIQSMVLLFGLNSVLNIYPIMQQRYNRIRVQKVFGRISDRKVQVGA